MSNASGSTSGLNESPEAKLNVPQHALDASMSRWRLSVSNADVRSAFEFVTIVGFRAPTRDEAQRVWLQLTLQQCGLHMPIASLIEDSGINSQPVTRRPPNVHDLHSNRELARVLVGETEMALDEFLHNQCIVNNGALAASPLIFNAAMYMYRHVNSYIPSVTKFPHSLKEVRLPHLLPAAMSMLHRSLHCSMHLSPPRGMRRRRCKFTESPTCAAPWLRFCFFVRVVVGTAQPTRCLESVGIIL